MFEARAVDLALRLLNIHRYSSSVCGPVGGTDGCVSVFFPLLVCSLKLCCPLITFLPVFLCTVGLGTPPSWVSCSNSWMPSPSNEYVRGSQTWCWRRCPRRCCRCTSSTNTLIRLVFRIYHARMHAPFHGGAREERLSGSAPLCANGVVCTNSGFQAPDTNFMSRSSGSLFY